MMNTAIFATIVNALQALDDTQGAQVLAVINGLASVSAPSAPAPTQAPAPKVYEPATDVTLAITPVSGAGKGKKAFKLGYGEGRTGAKMRIKDAGFAWDESVGAYVGTPAQYKALEITDNMLTVSAEWVQKGRDKAREKREKKLAKKGA